MLTHPVQVDLVVNQLELLANVGLLLEEVVPGTWGEVRFVLEDKVAPIEVGCQGLDHTGYERREVTFGKERGEEGREGDRV